MTFSHKYRSFLITISLIILSMIIPNQLIYSQESKEDASDLPSNNNDLLVSIEPQENIVAVGDHVNFIITVTDSDSEPVADVKIYGKMIYPDGIHEHTFEGKTQDNGKFVFPLSIDDKMSSGELKTQVKATMHGYETQSLNSTFSIVGSSDFTPKDNTPKDDFDHGFQYRIREIHKDRDAYSFAVAGDYGCDRTTRETVNAMKKKNPDLVLALGDLSEVKDPDCFFHMIKSLDEKGKLKIALGYHDMDEGDDSSSRFSQYLSHFDMVDPFYSFDYKNIHFLVMTTGLDSVIPYGKGSDQYNFIKSDLAQASKDEKVDWIIVCGYKPFYTSPTEHAASGDLTEVYPPLFEKYGVDLVITAHNHNYQRTYPLHSVSEVKDNPVIKDKNVNNYSNPGGPIYVTVGTASGDLYPFAGKSPFIANQFRHTGFLNINVLNNATQLNAIFLDDENKGDKDYFTINKS